LRKVTVHCEIRPKNGKRPTAHSRRTLSARQAVKRPESENGPQPALPQTLLPVLGRHAARDGNQPTGPLMLSASHAPGRNLDLGRESLFPPGLNLGPVIVGCPSQSDGCARFPAEQNRLRRPHANPSLISLLCSLSRAAASDRRVAPERACLRRRLEPLASVRAHRWVNAPASSGLSGASLRSLAPTRRRATALSRSRRRRRSRRGAPVRSWARPHTDSRWSGSTRVARRSTTRVSAADGDCEESEQVLSPTHPSVLLLPQP
jgi:hypothetical protein